MAYIQLDLKKARLHDPASFNTQVEPDIAPGSKGVMGAFARGTGSAISGIGSALRDVQGAEGIGQNMQTYGQNMVEQNPARYNSISDIKNPGDVVGFGGEKILEMIPQVGATLAGGTLATLAAPEIAVAGALGAAATGAGITFGQQYGETRETQRGQGIDDRLRAGSTAALAAGLDVATGIGGRLTKGFIKTGTKAAEKSLGREILNTAGEEAATEVGQTALQRYGGYQSLTNSEAMQEYATSALAGGLGGGVFGGGLHVLNRGAKNRADQRAADISEGKPSNLLNQGELDLQGGEMPKGRVRQFIKPVNFEDRVRQHLDLGEDENVDEVVKSLQDQRRAIVSAVQDAQAKGDQDSFYRLTDALAAHDNQYFKSSDPDVIAQRADLVQNVEAAQTAAASAEGRKGKRAAAKLASATSELSRFDRTKNISPVQEYINAQQKEAARSTQTDLLSNVGRTSNKPINEQVPEGAQYDLFGGPAVAPEAIEGEVARTDVGEQLPLETSGTTPLFDRRPTSTVALDFTPRNIARNLRGAQALKGNPKGYTTTLAARMAPLFQSSDVKGLAELLSSELEKKSQLPSVDQYLPILRRAKAMATDFANRAETAKREEINIRAQEGQARSTGSTTASGAPTMQDAVSIARNRDQNAQAAAGEQAQAQQAAAQEQAVIQQAQANQAQAAQVAENSKRNQILTNVLRNPDIDNYYNAFEEQLSDLGMNPAVSDDELAAINAAKNAQERRAAGREVFTATEADVITEELQNAFNKIEATTQSGTAERVIAKRNATMEAITKAVDLVGAAETDALEAIEKLVGKTSYKQAEQSWQKMMAAKEEALNAPTETAPMQAAAEPEAQPEAQPEALVAKEAAVEPTVVGAAPVTTETTNAAQEGEQPQRRTRQRKRANEVGTAPEASSSNRAEPVAETEEVKYAAKMAIFEKARDTRGADEITPAQVQALGKFMESKDVTAEDVQALYNEYKKTAVAPEKVAEPAPARRVSIESEKVALRKDITTTARVKKNLPAAQVTAFLTDVDNATSVADLKSIKADLDAQVSKNIKAPAPKPVVTKPIQTMAQIIIANREAAAAKRAAEKERMAGAAPAATETKPTTIKRPDLPKDQVKTKAEPEAKPEAKPEVTDENIVEDEEVDYDTHPLMVEHDEKYDDAQNRLGDTENTTEVRKLAKKFIKEGLIDEDNYDEIDTRIRDADQEDKFDEAKSAVEDALIEQQDNQRSDVESLIDEDVADKAAAKPAQFLQKTKVQPLADNAKQVAERAAVEAKFRAELDRLGVTKAGLRILTQLEGRAEYGRDVGGEYSPAKKLITVVMQPNSKGEYSLGHEAIHAMEHFGLILPQEKAAVLAWAKGQREIRDFIKSQYGEESQDIQNSEYVAEAYALWLKREAEFPGRINLFFRKLSGFLGAFKNYLFGRGFISADAVLEAVDSGFFTQRQRGKATLGQTSKSFFRESTASQEYTRANANVREWVGGFGNQIAASMVIANKLTDMAVRAGIPAARKMERLLSEQGRVIARIDRKVEDLSERFDGLKSATERGVGEGSVNNVIQKIRFAQKWGFDPMYKDADGKKITVDVDPELNKLFNKLSPEAQQVVRDVFQLSRDNLFAKKEAVMRTIGSEYDALIKNVQDELSRATGDRALKLTRELKALEGKKSRQLTRYNSLFKIDPNTPYAPIKRFGNFVVVGRSNAYLAAEQKAEREKTPEAYAELRKMQEDGEHYYVAYADDRWKAIQLRDKLAQVYDSPDMFRKDEASEAQLGGSEMYAAFQRMQKLIQEQGDSMDPQMRKSLTSLATDLYLSTLAESSSRKSEMAARLVEGGDFDMVRGAIAQGRSDSRFIGSVEKNGEVADTLAQMNREAKGNRTNTDEARELVKQISARHAANLAPAPQNTFVDKLLGFTTAMYLTTSPMFFVQQAVQPFMVSMPVAAARHGYGRTMDALNKGYDVVRQAWGDSDITKPLDLNKLTGKMWALGQMLADSSALDVGIDKDMGNWTSEANGPVAAAMNTVSKKIGGWTRKLEAINRLSTGAMMFELEMAKQTGSNVDPEAYASYVEDFKKSFPEGATDEHPMLSEKEFAAAHEAIRIINETHGDYSLKSSPLIMRSGAGRVLSQFKKFQIMQLSLYTQAINDGFFAKDIPAAEKEIARRTLLYMTGHAALFAGALGLPGAAAGEWLWELINKLMGREGPFSAESDLRKAIGNPTIANLLINGAPTLAGVDLSGSLGQGNLLSIAPYAEIPRDEDTAKDAIIRLLGPAIGGVAIDYAKALGFMADGQYYKGLEKMLPKGFSNAVKAYRESTEGVTDKGGEVTVGAKDIGIGATVATALGLRTTEVSSRQYRQGTAIETKQYFQDKTSTLKREYIKAYDKKDGAKMQELRVKWIDLQKMRIENGLTRQPIIDLMNAPRQLAKREQNVLGGVKTSKSNRALAEQLAEETGFVEPEEE